MNPVIVVTDSSAYLPQGLIASLPVRVIPLTLYWDGENYRDGIDIQATEFYTRLAISESLPTTSQLSAHELDQIFQGLTAEGYDVLLLPISSGISNSYQTAMQVSRNYPDGRVAVMDSKLVSMALGFQVLAAARAAANGACLADCQQVAEKAYGQIGVYFTVNTLKYLAAGGRINTAKRLLGAALNIKPILEIRESKIELVTSVMSRRKAIERLLSLVEEGIGGRSPVRISVFHALALQAAEELMETTQERFNPIECILAEVSPVVGSHTGPGTLSIAYRAGEELA